MSHNPVARKTAPLTTPAPSPGQSPPAFRPPSQPAAGVPADVRQLLGAAPVTSLESAEAYAALEAAVAAQVQPQHILEWLRLRDIVNLIWEAQRLRRARASIRALGRRKALTDLFNIFINDELSFETGDQLAIDYLEGDEAAATRLNENLAALGLPLAAVDDLAQQAMLNDLERLERLIANAEERWNSALRELQRSRDAADQRLAEAVEIIDAEVEK